MTPRRQPSRTVRIAGGLLAATWIAAGGGGILAAALTAHAVLALAGLAAVAYGVVWVRVARGGRLLTLREALTPWRGAKDRDARTAR
jgi:hypothetical protein